VLAFGVQVVAPPVEDEGVVIMSFDAYEEAQGRLELYHLLDEAESAFQNGDRGISVEAMRERLRQVIGPAGEQG
jgi:hypothetical protein